MLKHFLFGGGRKADSQNRRTKIKFAAMILFLVISLIGTHPSVAFAAGNTYYVDNTVPCSDSGAGTMANPFCTLAQASIKAVAGDTVRVLHGTYAETVYPLSGSAGQPVTFKANPGVTVRGNSAGFGSAFAISSGKSYIVIDGFNITETKYMGIWVSGANHITITNNHISYAGDPSVTDSHRRGIYLSGTTDSVITGNITDHNTCVGIMLINGSDHNIISNNLSFANASTVVSDAAGYALIGSSYNTVTNNIGYGNEDSGISIYDYNDTLPSSYNVIAGNLFYANGDHGIDNNDSPYNTIVGNTIHGNGTVGLNFEGSWVGSHHAIIANNIIAANGIHPNSVAFGGNLRVDPLSIDGTTLDYDLFDKEGASVQITWNGSYYASLQAFHVAEPGKEVHGKEGNPSFVDPATPVLRTDEYPYYTPSTIGDYHLSAGSPAIDSANAGALNQLVTDIEGNARIDDPTTVDSGVGTRTYDDRGAYEFQPTGISPTTTTVNCGSGSPVVTYRSSLGCVVTVTDGSGLNTPTGHVYFTTSGSGVFSTNPCTLSGAGGTATCSLNYVPRAVDSGSHLIKANYAGDSNFHPSSGSQAVTVNAKALVPAITVSSKTYDGTMAATILTRTVTGVLDGDIVALADGTASFNDKNVGTAKTVTGSSFSLTGLNAANYHLSPAAATTTANITPFAITVTADAKTKLVGDPDPALTYSVAPALLSGDNFTGALSRASGEDLGQYGIQQGTLSAGGNYTITYVEANLSIVTKPPADLNVYIGGKFQKNYSVLPATSTRDSYKSVNSGPVQLISTNDVSVMAAERVVYKVDGINTSFSEMMALPNKQLDKVYWLPWYNNKDLDTQLRFGNVSTTDTATVHIFIGGQEMMSGCTAPNSPYTLKPGESVRVSCAGISNGPVEIRSDFPIVAAERVVYKVNGINTSFSEMMALPEKQLDKVYWLPWYNNKELDTQLRFGNVSTTDTATVHIFIGDQEMTAPGGGPFILKPGESTRQSFAVSMGPVKIVSDIPIVAAERVVYKVNGINTSFTELLGLPNLQLDTAHWLPWYNNVDLDTQLRFGAP